MKTTFRLAVIWLLSVVTMLAAEEEALPPIGPDANLLSLLSTPPEKQNQFIRELQDKLAKSQVPTPKGAESAALSAIVEGDGLDMRERWVVTGLYALGIDVSDFASAGDLFWEVRITRSVSYPEGVSGIVWVSANNKAIKIVFR